MRYLIGRFADWLDSLVDPPPIPSDPHRSRLDRAMTWS